MSSFKMCALCGSKISTPHESACLWKESTGVIQLCNSCSPNQAVMGSSIFTSSNKSEEALKPDADTKLKIQRIYNVVINEIDIEDFDPPFLQLSMVPIPEKVVGGNYYGQLFVEQDDAWDRDYYLRLSVANIQYTMMEDEDLGVPMILKSLGLPVNFNNWCMFLILHHLGIYLQQRSLLELGLANSVSSAMEEVNRRKTKLPKYEVLSYTSPVKLYGNLFATTHIGYLSSKKID